MLKTKNRTKFGSILDPLDKKYHSNPATRKMIGETPDLCAAENA